MHILASALPGFRDLRAPLTAGYLWLLFVYLLVQPTLGTRPSNALGAALFDLANEVGRVWVAIGIGTAAYLVGSISSGFVDYCYSVAKRYRTVRRSAGPVAWSLLSLKGLLIPNYPIYLKGGGRGEDPLDSDLRILVRGASRALTEQFDRLSSSQAETRENRNLFRQAVREFEAELDLPATVLVDDRPALFAEVDRLRSEGDLRLAVSLPLFALVVMLCTTNSLWWLAALLGVFGLVAQGDRRRQESRQVIIDAIQQGKIVSSAVARIRTRVDELVQSQAPPA